MARKPYYAGPRSDHFDGERFFMAGEPPDESRGDLFKFLTRTPRAKWPLQRANPHAAPVVATVSGGALRVTSIGHASHLIQTRGVNILVDPVWSQRASPFGFAGPKRVRDPGMPIASLPRLDAILVTHNHYDHLDLATLDLLSKTHPCRIIAPLGNDAIIRRHNPTLPVETYDWDDRVAINPDVAVTLLPCHHWSARWLGDRRMALWAAFLIETPDGAIYHVGDTAYRDGTIFKAVPTRFGAPRLAILPIGAYEPRWFMRDHHVDPDESVQILIDCHADYALAHHWGTFQLTAEAIDDPPQRLAAALVTAGISPDRFRVQLPGEAFDIRMT